MMNYLEGIIMNLIFLLFPLFLYLLYSAYQKNMKKEEDTLFLSVALISSLYLIMRYGTIHIGNLYFDVLFYIPLLISYGKGKKKTAITISFILLIYHLISLKANPYFIVLEYIIYYFVYSVTKRKELTRDFIIHAFLLIKTFFLSMQTFYLTPVSSSFIANFIFIMWNMVVFYLVAYIVFILLQKGEEIISLNQSLKDLEKEKFLRTSLFKITHEIKNPIAVCKGYLDMLNLDDNKKVHQYIPIVKREIERTLTLMEDYSDYTKIKIEPDVMDIYLLLEDTINQLEPLFHEKKIEVSYSFPDDELYLEGDYNRLKQVLINLFKNALEATNSKRKSIIIVTVNETDNGVDITIKDNGEGMDEEVLSHISEMFYTTKQNGTGLGVALSNEIIRLHQGTMNYISKPKEGTAVTIKLPLQIKKEA